MPALTKPWGLHWFRRDLRIAGNPALRHNGRETGGRVLGVFCFDKTFLARPDFSPDRFGFFLDTLSALRDDLRAEGSDLLVLDIGPEQAFAGLLERLKKAGATPPALVTWNRDYEPFAVERDARMAAWFAARGLATHTERDHVLIEPHEIKKESAPASPYQVYTPFSRRWFETFGTPDVLRRVDAQAKGIDYLDRRPGSAPKLFSVAWPDLLGARVHAPDLLAVYRDLNAPRVRVPLPAAGQRAALAKLRDFKRRIDNYGGARDIPSVPGTSQLSIFFKNGSLTTAQVIAELGLRPENRANPSGRMKYFQELVWREFYCHILARFPHVETGAFQRECDRLKWENRDDLFRAWCEGRTGYPVVDAGMRQLNATGWMHNRVRMIVASFLVKDLLIDWRWGERYFMERLLDGDLAPNNGGWQWAASTGCDAQPWFRVFNPELQSRKFDPEGAYIRAFVPELRGLAADAIHAPGPLERGGYPAPVVDHAERRDRALALFRALKG